MRRDAESFLLALRPFFPPTTYPLPHLRHLRASLKLLEPDAPTSSWDSGIRELTSLRRDIKRLFDTSNHPTIMAMTLQLLRANVTILRRMTHEQSVIEHQDMQDDERNDEGEKAASGKEATSSESININEDDDQPIASVLPSEPSEDPIQARTKDRSVPNPLRAKARKYHSDALSHHKQIIDDFCLAFTDRQAQIALRKDWVMLKEADTLLEDARLLAWALGLENSKRSTSR